MSDDMELHGDELRRAREAVREEKAQELAEELRIKTRAYQIERAQPFVPPPVWTGKDFLAQESPEMRWAVDGIMAVGHNVLLASAYKVGKTTLLVNLVRSMMDRRPFLGRFETFLDGRCLYMNYEMIDDDLRVEIRRQGLRRSLQLVLMNLRETANPLATPEGRDWLVNRMKVYGVKLWVIDTFRRSYTGVSHNDNAEMGKFTAMLDEIKGRAGVENLVLSHHFGRKEHDIGQEHGQGAVELDNWADMRWLLTRGPVGSEGKPDRSHERFLKVEGRGAGLGESLLAFDDKTHRLWMPEVGLSRTKGSLSHMEDDIVALISTRPGCSQNTLLKGVSGNTTAICQKAVELTERGIIRREGSEKMGYRHYPGDSLNFVVEMDLA